VAHPIRGGDSGDRLARQRAYAASPSIEALYPHLADVALELHFLFDTGIPYASPYKRLFVPAMQAFFEVSCPDRNCIGGGFSLFDAVARAAATPDRDLTTQLRCTGSIGRQACSIRLRCVVTSTLRSA